jgi:hypothetical protein
VRPFRHPRATVNLTKPVDWNEAERGTCGSLPARYDAIDENFYSYWLTSWRERLAILFGRPIRLVVASAAHPPVCLDTEKD